jgi:hypothetical protein
MAYVPSSGALSLSNLGKMFGIASNQAFSMSSLKNAVGKDSSGINMTYCYGKVAPDTTDVAIWMDAMLPHTVVTSGGISNVSQWSDKSGNNFHVSQSASGNQPYYSSTLLSTKPSIAFSNLNCLQRSTSNSGTLGSSPSQSVFSVVGADTRGWNIVCTQWFNANGNGSGIQRWHFSLKEGNTNNITLYANGALLTRQSPVFASSNYVAGFVHSGANTLSYIANNGLEYPFTPTQNLNTASSDTMFQVGDIRNFDLNIRCISELLVYNRALPSRERAAVMSYLGNKWNIPVMMIDKLSSAGKTSLKGAFSIRRLSSSYTGPIINVRRGSDNVAADFYSDINGNLGTDQNGSGTSLISWLNGATGFITKWYDQSGVGNHATQTTNSAQPKIDQTNYYIDFSTNLFFNLPNGTVPFNNSNYTVVFKHNTITATNGGVLGSGSYSVANNVNAFRRYNTGYVNYWWDVDYFLSSFATGNVVSFVYNGANRSGYINGSLINSQASTNRASTNINNTIGVTNIPQYPEYLNGQLYFLYIFDSALSDQDRGVTQSF